MKKILVLGATGMLGHKACQTLVSAGHHVVACLRRDATSVSHLGGVFDGVELVGGADALVEGPLEKLIARSGCDFVVNAVGLVKQLDAASDPYLAVAINSLLPHRLAKACARSGARLIHVSTDCVFDGSRGGYRETDPPDAVDLYGRSKALGETTATEPAALTLRTSFIGRELKLPHHGLVEWLLAQGAGRVRGFARVPYSGLTSLELSRVIGMVVEGGHELSGVQQVAGPPISKLDLLRLVREVYGLDVEIEPVDEPAFDRTLVMGPFTEATGYRAPGWETMIRDMHGDPTPYDEMPRTSSDTEQETNT